MRGGKRDGAGAPKKLQQADKLATIRLTPEQHAKFLELGGSRWIKRLLEDAKNPLQPKP